jgi:hypothetical protein
MRSYKFFAVMLVIFCSCTKDGLPEYENNNLTDGVVFTYNLDGKIVRGKPILWVDGNLVNYDGRGFVELEKFSIDLKSGWVKKIDDLSTESLVSSLYKTSKSYYVIISVSQEDGSIFGIKIFKDDFLDNPLLEILADGFYVAESKNCLYPKNFKIYKEGKELLFGEFGTSQ